MPSLRNSGQNTFFPKQAKLSESFSCTYSFQILCLEFQTSCICACLNSKHACLEFRTCGISCTFRSSPDPECPVLPRRVGNQSSCMRLERLHGNEFFGTFKKALFHCHFHSFIFCYIELFHRKGWGLV